MPCDFELALDDSGLRGYTLRSPDPTRKRYRTVRFMRDGERTYFARLDQPYREREGDEARLGLARELALHYPAAHGVRRRAAKQHTREAHRWTSGCRSSPPCFQPDRDAARALAYLRAAVEFHPKSLDTTRLQLGGALAKAHRTDEARTAYREAKSLDGASDGGPHADRAAQIDEALAALDQPAA